MKYNKQNKTPLWQSQKATTRKESSPSLIDINQRLNQQDDDSIDMGKVERIRQSISRGGLEINIERLAQKIIDAEVSIFDACNKKKD
ncbi:MAG: flagellar biosynthesis anti-sigma factor FlgM [Candidatus Endonucleobacter sp. (ex Gigantidas childressi)]|nr:flagellar biosynthesis anti-sigma factor FlgM [Candidatus Endonucleobacter sp. (ex Gigantidas childressi)]